MSSNIERVSPDIAAEPSASLVSKDVADAADAPRRSRPARPKRTERILSVVVPLAVLALWELTARTGAVDTTFFPAPSTIAIRFWEMIGSGEMVNCKTAPFEMEWCSGDPLAPPYGHFGISAFRVIAGFILGGIPGVALGIAMGLFGPLRASIYPFVHALFPVPKVALLPIFILLLGIGELSKVAVIAVSVFFVVLINTLDGVRDIDQIYRDVAKNIRAPRGMVFWNVALPGALPSIMTGLRLGAGIALLTIVAAEFVGARSGIGYLIWTSWQVFRISDMYVGVIVIAVSGYLIAVGLGALQRRLTPWRPV